MSASGRERRQRGGSAPYSASRSSRVCARLSVCLPRTDAAAAAGLGDGLGGPSRTASASPRSIFKAASGLGRPPALPSLAPARPPARPPRLPAAARRQSPGLRRRGGASGRAAPLGAQHAAPAWGWMGPGGGGGGDLASDPAASPRPATLQPVARFNVSSRLASVPPLGRT